VNEIIEAGTKAIEHSLEPQVFIGESVAEEIARACWTAMVGALTDVDCHELLQNRIVYERERGDVKAAIDRFRAALLELMEVKDE